MKRAYDYDKGIPLVAHTRNGVDFYYDGPGHKPRCLDEDARKLDPCPRNNPEEGPSHDLGPLQQEIYNEYMENEAMGAQPNAAQRENGLFRYCYMLIHQIKTIAEQENGIERSRNDMVDFVLALRSPGR